MQHYRDSPRMRFLERSLLTSAMLR